MPIICRSVAILAAIPLFAGCAHLDIDVNIYDGPMPMPPDRVTQDIAQVLQSPYFEISDLAAQRDKAIGKIHDQIVAQGQDPAHRLNLDSFKKSWESTGGDRDALDAQWDKLVTEPKRLARSLADDLAAKMSAKVQPSSSESTGDVTSSARNDIEVQNRIFYGRFHAAVVAALDGPKRFVDVARGLLDGYHLDDQSFAIALRGQDMASADIRSGIASQETVDSRLVGYPLFDPAVAALPATSSDSWKPFLSNSFWAFGGDAQFVAVQEGTVVYHQKGLEFDPTPAISAAQATSGLALKVAGAMLTGNLVSAPVGSSGSVAAQQQTQVDLAQAQKNAALVERRKRSTKEFLLRLADLEERANDAQDDDVANLAKDYNNLFRTYEAQVDSGATP